MKIPIFKPKPRVDIAGLKASLKGFEQLAAEQAHLPVSERLKVTHADGTVIEDVVTKSIELCRDLIAEAEADRN